MDNCKNANNVTISEEWVNKMAGEKIDTWGLPKSEIDSETIRNMWIKSAKKDIRNTVDKMRRMGISIEQILLMEYNTIEIIIGLVDAENERYEIEDSVREWLDNCPV